MSNYTNTVDSMGDAAICKALLEKTLVEITDTHCTTIGGYAFYEFYDLRKAIFENATRIEQYAFAYCSKLETVEIPLAENVGYFSFYECTKLKKADFPNVKSVNRYAFKGSTELETLVLRSTTMATLADVNALVDTRIEDGKGYIYVPSALIDSYKADSKWSTYANQFRRLEDYTVDGTITGEWELPSMARSLVRRTIKSIDSETITSVGQYAFYYCSTLTSVNLPNVTSVGVNAFGNCRELTSVNLPNVQSIGNNAFIWCSNMMSVKLPAIPPSLAKATTFSNINNACTFYIPRGSLEAYQSHSTWTSLVTKYSFVEEDR